VNSKAGSAKRSTNWPSARMSLRASQPARTARQPSPISR
jgi:hypothetical protein